MAEMLYRVALYHSIWSQLTCCGHISGRSDSLYCKFHDWLLMLFFWLLHVLCVVKRVERKLFDNSGAGCKTSAILELIKRIQGWYVWLIYWLIVWFKCTLMPSELEVLLTQQQYNNHCLFPNLTNIAMLLLILLTYFWRQKFRSGDRVRFWYLHPKVTQE